MYLKRNLANVSQISTDNSNKTVRRNTCRKFGTLVDTFTDQLFPGCVPGISVLPGVFIQTRASNGGL